MEFGRGFMFMMILSVIVSTGYSDDTDVGCNCSNININRDAFPPGFLFGASTASYQVYRYIYIYTHCMHLLITN